MPAQPGFNFWRIFLNPAIDRGMINTHAPFTHHLFKIALKRVASNLIHATRFISLFLCMSLSRNRCTLSGDMH